ncbi:hypothetical protein [Halopseudomonas salina]|uniref:Uncharacterized protein n=1 Tax=Halopseudomonas salina TaxID=1323744 RepID=A0ABQ1PAN3_9GAMM|nr:hypothetical protein [Halopseudomonas salina]GGC92960.1 hypothetical protein GCM10007418_10580 [Halopseudomonas salina]
MNNVPDSYLGGWQRTLLRTADGHEDRDTRVFWLQTASVHADLRIPEPTPMTVDQRISQAGFAGLTEVESDRCQWHRLVDFHPDSGTDVGLMTFISPDEVHEAAPDGSYLEVWQRLPESIGATHAIWLEAVNNPQRKGCLLQAGDCFMFVADRPTPARKGVPLRTQITGLGADQAEFMMGCEFSFGRVSGGDMPWEITLSSLPGRTGRCLLLDPPEASLSQWPVERLATLGGYPPSSGWQCAPLPLSSLPEKEVIR